MANPRLFRIFQWNDFHVRDTAVSGRTAGYPRCNEKAAWARRCAQGFNGLEPPEFIVSAGDLIDGEIGDFDRDFAALRNVLLDGLTLPLLPCLGNHENQQGEGVPAHNAAYDRFFGPRWHNYLFTRAGVGFVVIDSSGGHREADEVTTARLEFARRALDRLAGMPLLVVTHVPLIAMRQPEVLAKSFGFSSWVNLDSRLKNLLESRADAIVAVLSGHLHITGVQRENGVWHIVPSGTAGYPSDFASIDVYPDRLQVTMHAAPAELVGPDKRGNIHGKERHGIDFTDASHPDPESYVSGAPQERKFVIPLHPAQRPDPRKADEPLRVWHEIAPGEWSPAEHDLRWLCR